MDWFLYDIGFRYERVNDIIFSQHVKSTSEGGKFHHKCGRLDVMTYLVECYPKEFEHKYHDLAALVRGKTQEHEESTKERRNI